MHPFCAQLRCCHSDEDDHLQLPRSLSKECGQYRVFVKSPLHNDPDIAPRCPPFLLALPTFSAIHTNYVFRVRTGAHWRDIGWDKSINKSIFFFLVEAKKVVAQFPIKYLTGGTEGKVQQFHDTRLSVPSRLLTRIVVNINRVNIESKICLPLWRNLNRGLFKTVPHPSSHLIMRNYLSTTSIDCINNGSILAVLCTENVKPGNAECWSPQSLEAQQREVTRSPNRGLAVQ